MESILFSEQEYDLFTTVDIKVTFNGIKRKIKKIENIGSLVKHLKASERICCYFDLNKWHRINDHPINNIIISQSLKIQKENNVIY